MTPSSGMSQVEEIPQLELKQNTVQVEVPGMPLEQEIPSSVPTASKIPNRRKDEKRKSFTTVFKLEKVLEFKNQSRSSNKFSEYIGVSPSTFQGWVADHRNGLLTSVTVAMNEPSRKRLRISTSIIDKNKDVTDVSSVSTSTITDSALSPLSPLL